MTPSVDLFKQILEIAADQFYSIGIKSPNEGFGIRKNNMRNIPDRILNSFGYPAPAPTNPSNISRRSRLLIRVAGRVARPAACF